MERFEAGGGTVLVAAGGAPPAEGGPREQAAAADPSRRSDLLAIAQGADNQGWLRPYHSALPGEYTAYISFEAEARSGYGPDMPGIVIAGAGFGS